MAVQHVKRFLESRSASQLKGIKESRREKKREETFPCQMDKEKLDTVGLIAVVSRCRFLGGSVCRGRRKCRRDSMPEIPLSLSLSLSLSTTTKFCALGVPDTNARADKKAPRLADLNASAHSKHGRKHTTQHIRQQRASYLESDRLTV